MRKNYDIEYRSGVAARLAGVPVQTLRVWERRYAVVGPRTSAGRQRLYSTEDVRRLALIKQLVDAGHPIGSLAPLDNDALREIFDSTAKQCAVAAASDMTEQVAPFRLALIGSMLVAESLARSSVALDVVASGADAASVAQALGGRDTDAVVLSLSTLTEADLDRVEHAKSACRARAAIVLYRYAPAPVVHRLRAAGHAVARATTDPEDIDALCRRLIAPRAAHSSATPPETLGAPVRDAQPAPAPRFDDAALALLARGSPAVHCECPRHLAELVASLGAFERYSAQCANRSPGDAALHRSLERAAGHARAIVEQALEHVAIAEGMHIPTREAK